MSVQAPWFVALQRLWLRATIAWNFVQAKLHHAYPCGRCGYRYDCPDGECHS